MSEPLTFTELDERTKEELQPPCEQHYDGKPVCSTTAAWAIVTLCHGCGPRPVKLICDYHAQIYFAAAVASCRGCGSLHPYHVISAVRL